MKNKTSNNVNRDYTVVKAVLGTLAAMFVYNNLWLLIPVLMIYIFILVLRSQLREFPMLGIHGEDVWMALLCSVFLPAGFVMLFAMEEFRVILFQDIGFLFNNKYYKLQNPIEKIRPFFIIKHERTEDK